MGRSLVSIDDLKQLTGYKRTGDVAKSLDDMGIKYFHGCKGVIYTTINLIDAAGGLVKKTSNEIDVDSII